MSETDQPVLNVGRFPGNARCAVTTSWDDNDSESMEIMRILDSMKLRGTFYVDPGNPRGTPGWASNGLADSDLRALAVEHEVGSHTWSHVDVRGCDVKTLREELIRSKEYLENVLRGPVHGLAYPYGAYSPVCQRMAKECGYLYARTTVEGNTEFPPSNPHLWGISIRAVDMSPYLLRQFVSRTILNRAGRMYVRNLALDWQRMTWKLLKKAHLTHGVLHVQGHALEILRRPRLKEQFMEVCRRIALRNDVWYATNRMLFLNDLLKRSVRISQKQNFSTRSIFWVHAKRPSGIRPGECPIPLSLSVPKNWGEDFVVEATTVTEKAEIGKLAQQAWIDIYGDEAEITVSQA